MQAQSSKPLETLQVLDLNPTPPGPTLLFTRLCGSLTEAAIILACTPSMCQNGCHLCISIHTSISVCMSRET